MSTRPARPGRAAGAETHSPFGAVQVKPTHLPPFAARQASYTTQARAAGFGQFDPYDRNRGAGSSYYDDFEEEAAVDDLEGRIVVVVADVDRADDGLGRRHFDARRGAGRQRLVRPRQRVASG